MKSRFGFVSNSSSSSFLIAIAKINDLEKFNQHFGEIPKYEAEIISTSELYTKDRWYYKFKDNKIIVEGIDYSTIDMAVDPSKEDLYFVAEINGHEGDSFFIDEDDYEPNYDIVDENWFEGFAGKVARDLTHEHGIEESVVHWGACRDG